MPAQSLLDKEKTVPKRGPSPWIKKTTRPASGFLHIIIRWNQAIPADFWLRGETPLDCSVRLQWYGALCSYHLWYDCPAFIQAFMNSRTAAALDDSYDHLQWAGKEYILEELNDEMGGLKKAGTLYSVEVMYWACYTCRYWHYYTGESSKAIFRLPEQRP